MGLHNGDSSDDDDDDYDSSDDLGACGSEAGLDFHQRARVEREFEKVQHFHLNISFLFSSRNFNPITIHIKTDTPRIR